MTTKRPTPRQSASRFDELSDTERQVVGSPADYDWDASVRSAARRRPDMTQFSIRLERDLYQALQAAADREGVTFSDVARAALKRFAAGGEPAAISDIVVTIGSTPMLVQIKGQVAQFPSSRRFQLPDERVTVSDERLATTAG